MIEELPSDELMTMTKEMHRLFNVAGCDPECHVCGADILVGMEFQLATMTTRGDHSIEVMLCSDPLCKAIDAKAPDEDADEKDSAHNSSQPEGNGGKSSNNYNASSTVRGCFRINGKITA